MQRSPIEASGGKYRWTYEMSLFKNPTIFLTVAKALGITVAVTALLIGIISWIADGFSAESLLFAGKLFLILAGIFAVLLILGYLIYAAVMGGRFILDFTMDEKVLVCSQSAAQADRAEKIGLAAMLLGLLTHTRGAVSAGYAASSRTESAVELGTVKKVVTDKKHGVIKLRTVGWDQVWADGEDFDFVAGWIRRHIPESAEWREK